MAAPDKVPPDLQATSVGPAARKPATSSGSTPFAGFAPQTPPLEPGTVIAGRYEILAVLGEGGMGAVYKVQDRTLDRVVALKTIRPEMAASGDMVARFKQEILLASRITHRNVIRLYDIGEAPGIRFITMECIDGTDLRSLLLEKGKLLPAEAVEIIRQVCLALEAAHAQGVIHRDLKPQNVMRENETGRVVVMDFGLARTLGLAGMTQTGALVGTMEYMSPEQAMADDLDVRSDIFTVGLIFYELLTGKMPYKAETALASLLKRAQERAVPASEVEASVPRPLSDIVAKCLERDRNNRYQSVSELLAALDEQAEVVPVRLSVTAARPRRPMWQRVVVLGILGLALAGAGVVLRQRWSSSAQNETTAGPAVSLAVLPLRNASGDAALNWLGASIADMIGTDIGQAAQLRTVSSDRVRQILQDLRLEPSSGLDYSTVKRLAEFAGAGVVVTGQYVKFGDQLRLDLTIRDLKHDRTTPIKVEAANENELPGAVDRLAQSIRASLALPADAIRQLEASAFKPSTKSVDALRAYNEGLEDLRRGNALEAEKAFVAATKADPQFAVAYSKLAQADANLGYDEQAEQASRRAVELSDALPPAEKYRIGAEHARIMKDFPKAIEAYERLAKVVPQDADVQFALARLYEDSRSAEKAREHYERLLAADPKNADALLGMARAQLLHGDPQASLDYLTRALTVAVQLGNADQKGTALFFLGTAYALLNQSSDAMRNFQESLDVRRSRGDKGGTAQTLNSIAQLEVALGQPAQALKSYEEALRIRREIGDKHGMANTLLDLGGFYEARGQYDEALDLTKQALQLHRELGDPLNQATSLSNIGWIYLDKSDFENAMTYFQQALDLREKLNDPSAIADSYYNLADTSSRMGQYDAAVNYFMRAIDLWRQAGDKRGVATADYGLGTLFAYQGRYGAAVKSQADALKNFHEVNEKGIWLVQAQAAYGHALALAGRNAEAEKNLTEALAAARQLKNGNVLAAVLNLEADRLFYAGDYNAARSIFEQALATASRANGKQDTLAAKLGLAKIAVREGAVSQVLKPLQTLSGEADRAALKYISVECSTYRAEALLNSGNPAGARAELERILPTAEKLNLRALQARSHYLMAAVLRASGDTSEASRQSTEAQRLLDQIQQETGTPDVLKRSDLASISQPRVR